jgi:hypothetical protein
MAFEGEVIVTQQPAPTLRQLLHLAREKEDGTDTLKQVYQWRQDRAKILPQALLTTALTLFAGIVTSELKTELKAPRWAVALAVAVAVSLVVFSRRSIQRLGSALDEEYIIAIEVFAVMAAVYRPTSSR